MGVPRVKVSLAESAEGMRVARLIHLADLRCFHLADLRRFRSCMLVKSATMHQCRFIAGSCRQAESQGGLCRGH